MASERRILCLFDVDGTLTKSRQIISDDLLQFLLEKVKPLATLALVSGSDYDKIVEQMGGEVKARQFDHVFSENGLVHHRAGEQRSAQSILALLGEAPLQRVINFALAYMARLQLPAKRGTFVEFRAGMINLCPVGRSCTQQVRDEFVKFDVEHGVRQKFVDALVEEFRGSGLQFALGGQISVDVFPTGWDKTYCLNHIDVDSFQEIHFFGDKCFSGGNDYEIYNDHRTIGHEVTSPTDTKQQLIQCLHIC